MRTQKFTRYDLSAWYSCPIWIARMKIGPILKNKKLLPYYRLLKIGSILIHAAIINIGQNGLTNRNVPWLTHLTDVETTVNFNTFNCFRSHTSLNTIEDSQCSQSDSRVPTYCISRPSNEDCTTLSRANHKFVWSTHVTRKQFPQYCVIFGITLHCIFARNLVTLLESRFILVGYFDGSDC